MMLNPRPWPVLLITTLAAAGCQSPYRSDQGALFGGALGAGTGALIGSALGHTGAGAAIGAGVGALSGAAVGGELDRMEAQNRAQIEATLGRQVRPGAVTIDDVIAMTRSGVAEDLIVNHVRINGMVAPLQAGDLIFLQQQGVSPGVIAAMQAPPPVRQVPVATTVVRQPPPVVIVDDPWCDPWWPHRYHFYRHRHYHRPSVSWGVSFSDCH